MDGHSTWNLFSNQHDVNSEEEEKEEEEGEEEEEKEEKEKEEATEPCKVQHMVATWGTPLIWVQERGCNTKSPGCTRENPTPGRPLS